MWQSPAWRRSTGGHGWLCDPLLVAVGYLEGTKVSAPDSLTEWMRERYGSEFPALEEPYAERQMRALRQERWRMTTPTFSWSAWTGRACP